MSLSTQATPQAQNRSKTTLWYTRCPCATAFSVAWQQGAIDAEFAADRDVEFLSLQQSSDPKVHQSHYTHTQENSFRYGGNIPAIWARSRGADSRLVGLAWTENPHPILTLPSSGIRTVADLRGKRLLVIRREADPIVDFSRITTLRIYESALATAGLTLKDVHLVEVASERLRQDPKAIAASRIKSVTGGDALSRRGAHREAFFALIRGEVDVIALPSAAGTEAKALLDAHVVYDAVRDNPDKVARANNSYPEALTISGRLIDERPDLVARVVLRLLEAGKWARENPDKATSFVAREQSVVDEVIEATYGPGLVDVFATDLDDDKIATLRSQKDYLLRNGFIQDFDFDSWIDPRPLKAARELFIERYGFAP